MGVVVYGVFDYQPRPFRDNDTELNIYGDLQILREVETKISQARAEIVRRGVPLESIERATYMWVQDKLRGFEPS